MTKYCFYVTNADKGVLCTDGKRCYICPQNDGFDGLSGIDLYAEDAPELLKEAYAEVKGLYRFCECENEFDTEIIDFCEDDYENLIEICEKE